MTALPACPGHWLDTDVPCSDHVLTAVKAGGYQGIFRYVPLPYNPPHFDISAGELARIIGHGLQCGLVQHVRGGVWDPGQHSGSEDGRQASGYAASVGYPVGAHLWLDLEAVSGSAADTITFCESWMEQVVDAGYRAGLYCGYADPLSPRQLYDLAGFDSYWTDAGHRTVETRDCAVHQQAGAVTIAGVQFDRDEIAADLLGGLPWVASDPAAADTDPAIPRVLA